ncbi:Egg protein [Schistosoma japonicum]|uniref:Egg protein n=1 Tax=Schistosoma japonicum TaxID=6182 RepID=A0A4Z2D2C7_SCHJA|nr:Egg protein [Schistosoma japonicum]
MEATTKRHVEEQTKSATDFQPHKNESSNVKYIVVIVLGVVVIVSFIVGMFVWKYYMTNH